MRKPNRTSCRMENIAAPIRSARQPADRPVWLGAQESRWPTVSSFASPIRTCMNTPVTRSLRVSGQFRFKPGLVGSDAGFLSFFHDAAVEEMDRALGEAGVALVVRHHADGRAVAVQVAQQFHHGLAVFRGQV